VSGVAPRSVWDSSPDVANLHFFTATALCVDALEEHPCDSERTRFPSSLSLSLSLAPMAHPVFSLAGIEERPGVRFFVE